MGLLAFFYVCSHICSEGSVWARVGCLYVLVVDAPAAATAAAAVPSAILGFYASTGSGWVFGWSGGWVGLLLVWLGGSI